MDIINFIFRRKETLVRFIVRRKQTLDSLLRCIALGVDRRARSCSFISCRTRTLSCLSEFIAFFCPSVRASRPRRAGIDWPCLEAGGVRVVAAR